MRYRKAFLILAGLPLLISAAMAQSTSAIVGAARDRSAAVIPEVEITITDVATGSQRIAKTNADGAFVAENLKPGNYELAASKTGFAAKKVTGIVLHVSERLRVDFAMEVGSVSEQVEVKGEALILQTDSSSVGKVIESQDITNLPL